MLVLVRSLDVSRLSSLAVVTSSLAVVTSSLTVASSSLTVVTSLLAVATSSLKEVDLWQVYATLHKFAFSKAIKNIGNTENNILTILLKSSRCVPLRFVSFFARGYRERNFKLTKSVHNGCHPTTALSARCTLVTNTQTVMEKYLQ